MTTAVTARQSPLVASCSVGIANLGTGNGYTIKLPPGALLDTVGWQTVTAFDSGTTATGTVSDGTTTFVDGVDLTSAGAETVGNLAKYYPNGGTLTVSAAETGTAATAGQAIVTAKYIVLTRATEVQE